MANVGMTVPMWFCPVRPDEYNNADSWFRATYGRGIASVADLYLYLANWGSSFLLLSHCWWVPRPIKYQPPSSAGPIQRGPGFVGSSYNQTILTSGRLFLGFNDEILHFWGQQRRILGDHYDCA